MEKFIGVTVGVNSKEHADLIQKEIIELVKNRIVIYFVGEATKVDKFISKLEAENQ